MPTSPQRCSSWAGFAAASAGIALVELTFLGDSRGQSFAPMVFFATVAAILAVLTLMAPLAGVVSGAAVGSVVAGVGSALGWPGLPLLVTGWDSE